MPGQEPQQQTQSPSAIPDAPRPQAVLPTEGVTPGKGAAPDAGSEATDAGQPNAPGTSLPQTPQNTRPDDGPPPETPAAGEASKVFTLARVQVNFVEVPFTVKDSKGQLVPGLTWRDVRVYENGYRQQMRLFTVDPFPLSVALVIDQSMPTDTMVKVNNALGALQGAFSPYDEVAVFTYNNGPKQETDFTAAQSARLGAVLERSKGKGRDALYYDPTGPLGQTTNINGRQFDPNTSPVRNQNGINLNVPKEVHTLNDAILAAAVSTTKAGQGRRRIVYVISDGKEYGSTAKFKDVVKYLQTNKIAVYSTLVGDSAIPGMGFLDRIHLPLTMRDNILPLYAAETGGQIDAEFRQKGIETSFQRITEEVRTQYTVGYYSHEPFIDGKYRSIEVKVLRPNLTVIAKKGYFPTAASTTAPTGLQAR
jgi:VWFA-related protein